MHKRNQSGFMVTELIIALVVLVIIGAIILKLKHQPKHQPPSSQPSTGQTSQGNQSADQPLVIKSIGFNLDYYDPATNHAGDMVFTHEDHDLGLTHMIFSDFGIQDARSPNDPSKRNPQPTFVLPLGTKVHSLVDGVVIEIKDLYSQDQTIWVAKDASSHYIYETEHIINPTVKKGDLVKGGQVIGEVSPHDSQYHPGFGIVEIGILHPSGSTAQHICPFHYLDPAIKMDIQKKILAVHQAWMRYINRPDLYDDAQAAEPGCFVLTPVNG